MAYKLRYFKEFTHADGKVIRLEIHKKDSTAGAIEIGAVVQGLSLQIQGQQGDIDSPIVKTSLSMTFVDAQDIEDGRKNGFWEEFYTPDSVLWKVLVKAKDSQGAEFRTIWGGYVTPDSFTEDLVYRGSVNIIARDNIGHMQDFPFDAEGDADGMISLYNLVSSAWAKIDSPMSLDWRGESDSIWWMTTGENIPAYDTLMNVSVFEGKNWYQALEKALYSYGVVMRYAGNNRVIVCSLRSMPDYGLDDSLQHLEPIFVSGATRELVPAVKRIEESVEYGLNGSYQPRIKVQDFSGNTFNLETSWGVVENISWPLIYTSPMYSFGWYNEIVSKSLAFNPMAYPVDEDLPEDDAKDLQNYTCILTGSKNDNTHSLSYGMTVNAEDYAIEVTFGKFLSRLSHGYGDYFLGYPLNAAPSEYTVRYAMKLVQNGITYYLSPQGAWIPNLSTHSVTVSGDKMVINVPLASQFKGKVFISLIFLNIDTGAEIVLIKQVYGITLQSISSKPLLEKNTVNTNYKAENNVVISRDPEFGPAYNSVALPGFIKNGIFYREGGVIVPAKKWAFGRAGDQQMAVYNHLQLLAYYAKPNNLISGTIVNGDVTRVACIYDWHGAEHMLVSGTYNLLNGHIESAVLREFARYEDMWSDVAGADMPDTEQESRSNMEGGGASGGGASSTYTNTTDVNVGGGGGGTGASYLNDLLDVDTDGVVAQSVLYFNGTSWVDMSLATLLNPYVKAEAFNPVKAWFDKLGMLIVEEGGNVVVKTNLVIEGDMASGGAGENPGGGGSAIGGIMVNGIPYTDDDGDSFITLPDYPKKLSALENDLNLGSFAYKNALAVSDIPDLSGKYLPKAGGTISGASGALTIARTDADQIGILFKGKSGGLGYLGFGSSGTPAYINISGTPYTLLHSGNVGEYTLKNIGATTVAESELPPLNTFGLWHTKGPYIRFGMSEAYNITIRSSSNKLQALINASEDGDWKTIAFTDSDITGNAATATRTRYIESQKPNSSEWYGDRYRVFARWTKDNYNILEWATEGEYEVRVHQATKLATARTIWGQSFDGTGNVSGNLHMGGYDIYWHSDSTHYCIASQLRENASPQLNINFYGGIKFNTGGIDRMLINGNGNVLIGTTADDGISGKLIVETGATIRGYASANSITKVSDLGGKGLCISASQNRGAWGMAMWTEGSGNGFIQQQAFSEATTYALCLNPFGGNVGIGTTDPKAKLHVSGDLRTYGDVFFFDSSGNNRITFTHVSDIARIYKMGNSSTMYIGDYNGNALNIVLHNVGIGTTDPQYKLDVAGTGRFTGKVSASGGIDIPNGQQLAFLDASGNRHTIAWDSASNGILIDGNLIVLGELATGLPMQEIPSIPEIGV